MRRADALSLPIELDGREQRRPSDAGLGVGLNHARYRLRDVQIRGADVIDDGGQFARAEQTPPVERRHGSFRATHVWRFFVMVGQRDGGFGRLPRKPAAGKR